MSTLVHALPPWALALSLIAHVAAGLGLGSLHFGGLWWTARLFAEGGRAATAAVVMLGRLAVLAGALTLVSFEGAPQLLATATGVLVARSLVTRRIRRGRQ